MRKAAGRVLVGMVVLSASVSVAQLPPLGSEFQVNVFTLGSQEDADVACATDGSSVTAYEGRPSVNDHGSVATIYSQRLDPDGMKLGAPIEVPTGGPCGPTRFSPSICRDTNGNTVEVYSLFPDGDVRGQRYDASGAALGSEFQISTGLGTPYLFLFYGGHDVGCEDNGDFVVVWQDLDFANQTFQLSGQRYTSAGTLLGGKFQVNSHTSYPFLPSISLDDDGDFVVAWTEGLFSGGPSDGDEAGVFARRFNSSGTAFAAQFQVNTYTIAAQLLAKVATDGDGDFVIVWMSAGYPDGQDGDSSGIFGRRFASNGTAQGTEFQVNTYTYNDQEFPSVASDQNGNFVVVWTSGDYSGGQDGSNSGIFGQRFASSGSPLGSEFLVNAYTDGRQLLGSVGAADNGDFLVNWIDDSGLDGSSSGSFAQRFASGGGKVGAEFQVNTYTLGPQGLIGPSFGFGSPVSCEDGGRCGIAWSGIPEQPSATFSEVYLRHYDTGGNPETGEIIPPLAPCETTRLNPSVCRDTTGDFVVVWEDISGYSYFSNAEVRIAGQRYTSAGAADGSEFQVNTYTYGYPERPDVACLGGGEFLVVWEQEYIDGDEHAVLGRRFTSSGSTGSEFLVNSYTDRDQYNAAIATFGTDLVVVWTSQNQQVDDYGGGIFGQRLSTAGTPLGTEFQVSVHTVGSQIIPAVAGFGSGFVVTWMDEYLDGGQYGIFARVYDTSGTALGDDFQVNTYTEDVQVLPAVSADASGNFMVVWQTFSVTDGDNDVFGRYFDSTGAPLSGEILVNSPSVSYQSAPTVCAAGDGTRFVTAWNSESLYGSINATAPGQAAASGSGFRSRTRRRFTGQAFTGQSFAGQPFAASAQAARSFAAQAAGPVDSQDGSFSGIFGQIFGFGGEVPPPGAPPEITGGATPGSEEVSGRNGPNRGANCLRVYALGPNGVPDNGGPDDELLGQGGTDANGNFSIMLLRALVAGDRIYIIDVCPPFNTTTPQVGPIALIFDPAAAPALSWTMLAAALLLLSGIALIRLRHGRSI